MPLAIPNGTLIEFRIDTRFMNQQCLNVFHFVLDHVGGLPDYSAAMADFLTEVQNVNKLYDKWQACVSSDVGHITLYAQAIFPTRYAYVTAVPFIDQGGALAGAEATNCAVAITKRAITTGRHSHGVLHMFGVPQGFTLNSQLNGVGLPPFQDLVAVINNNVVPAAGTIWRPVIFNKDAPADSQEVDNCVLADYLRVMRRRTVGLGS